MVMKPAEFSRRKEGKGETTYQRPVLPGFNFVFVFQEKVDVIEGIFKTVFLVAVDVEMLLEVAGRVVMIWFGRSTTTCICGLALMSAKSC